MPVLTPLDTTLPPAVVASATAGIELTLRSILGEQPVRTPAADETASGPMLAAVISFVGELKWSMTVTVTEPVGAALVEKFCGFAIPFDSDDMADAFGELLNVVAGEVTLQLEKWKSRGRMSLPTVVRGHGLQLFANRTAASCRVGYRLSFGEFSVGLLAAGLSTFARLPGLLTTPR